MLARTETKSEVARQEDAIAALLVAPTVEAAAALAGIPQSTLRQWLKDQRFDARYQAARQEVLDDLMARLEQLAGSAIEALVRNLTCGVPEVEVEAAKAILGHALATSPDGQNECGRLTPAAAATRLVP